MLAYSSIAHAGYALIGVVVAGRPGATASSTGLPSVLLYLAIYSFMTLGAFALVGLLRKEGLESDNIEDYAGLAKREPLAAFFMLIFLVSLAGIPPTAGFIGKFYLFMAAVHGGMAWLAVVAVIFAAISAFYYLRIVMVMYMREPEDAAASHSRLETSPALSFVLACAIAGVVFLGLFPNGLWTLASQAAPLLK
jgi:NADH-quinone oxidoreductase subunit N